MVMGERMGRREIRDSHRTQGTTSRSKLPNSPWTVYQIILDFAGVLKVDAHRHDTGGNEKASRRRSER